MYTDVKIEMRPTREVVYRSNGRSFAATPLSNAQINSIETIEFVITLPVHSAGSRVQVKVSAALK